MRGNFTENHYLNSQLNDFVVWGATGEGIEVISILHSYGKRVVGLVDDTYGLKSPFNDIPIFYGNEGFHLLAKSVSNIGECGFVVAIGNPYGRERLSIANTLIEAGLTPTHLAHRSAVIDSTAQIETGSIIHAGAVICARSKIGSFSIVNTRASVDHESVVGKGCEIGPGATVCGAVDIRDYAWIGAGATVLPRIKIGMDAIVGAGAVVIEEVKDHEIVVGVPAKPIKRVSNE
jgi:sugar O-acyltransferase (sialic acid O-acetyltransferase NeuD family)